MMYSVFDDIYRLNREINRFLRNEDYSNYRSYPAVNIYESKDEYALVVKLPGVEKDSIKITTKEKSIQISGERAKQTGENVQYYLNERTYGKFERNFMFDEKINSEKVSADLKDGLLLIKLPKAEEAKPKMITIN